MPISGGIYKNNMWLSTARATEVFEYFVHTKKLKAKYLEPTGRAAYEPVASNKNQKGRAQNRRVEIKIYTKLLSGGQKNEKKYFDNCDHGCNADQSCA